MSLEQTKQKIRNLEDEKRDLMSRYSIMKTCQQDHVDDRIGEIEEELSLLRAS